MPKKPKPGEAEGIGWIASPPGWWISREESPGIWRDRTVRGWDEFGAVGYVEGVSFRADPVDVFHERERYVHRGFYPRS